MFVQPKMCVYNMDFQEDFKKKESKHQINYIYQ